MVQLPSAAALVLLGSLAFAGGAQAEASNNTHAQAATASANEAPVPSWFHTPLSTTALRNEIAVPTNPETLTGKLRLTHADYRNAHGRLAVDASQAIGRPLLAGESLQLPGDTLSPSTATGPPPPPLNRKSPS